MKRRVVRMTKITKVIKVSEILSDILDDRSDEEILEKYGINWNQLEKIYGKLFYGGYLDKFDMRRRLELRNGKGSSHIPYAEIKDSGALYECLTCGFSTPLHFSVCPRCRQVNLRRLRRSSLPPASPYHTGYGVSSY